MLESFFMLGESIISKLGEKLVEFTFNQDDGATLEALQRNIRSLCAKAKDVDEQIKMAELCSRKKRKRVVEDWLEQVQLIKTEFQNLETEIQREGFIKRYLGRGRAKKLDSRVHELDEKSNIFGELVIDSYDFKGEKFSTSGLVGEEFQKNLEHIMRWLLEDKVPSIGIHGMGGVGKTALVKYVNNQLMEQTQEHVSVVWITVSQEFTIAKLQDKIAKVLGLDPLEESDEDRRASKLNRVLSQQKNFVMIFDDVWEKIDFRKLGDPHSIDGCRLLITSRSKTLCHQLDCKKLIEVQTLKQKEACSLFTDTLAQDNLSPEVEEIAKSLVKLCKGLPLGIITLAGTMKGEYDIHVWRNSLEELRGSIMEFEEQVFNVVKYSFDRLDRIKAGKINCYSKLQQCFLCCSLFPEDHEIRRDDLIEIFILEEYLDKRDNRKALFEQGHAILDQLVNVSLLERVDRGRACVKMHHLVRGMALKITEGTTKVMAGNGSLTEIPNDGEWTKELEKMSLMMSDIRTIPESMSVECPKLSTLILSHNRDLEFIPKSFLLHMCNLSILDLSFTKIKRLPDEVSNRENLKALILGGCSDLVYVPCLEKLEKLRKLDMSWTAIREVPQGTEKLINLQFLALDGISKLQMLPSNFVLNFQYLQYLYLPNHIHVKVEELTELKYLEEFHGRVKDWNDFLHLIRSRKNLGYIIEVQQFDSSYPFARFRLDYNRLHLGGCDVKELKDEDVDVLELGIIRHLLIKKCEGWSSNILVEDIGQLINPTFLEELTIRYCGGIERIIRKKQCGGAISTSTSPLIVFTSLTSLSIECCKNIKSLGISVTQLPNLRDINIVHCTEMEEIFEVEKKRELYGSGHMQTASSLSKLRHISLWGLPKLKSINNATIVCASLEWIEIRECESLKKFPVVFGKPNYDSPPLHMTRIGSIVLRRSEMEWWKKMELGHPTHHTLLQPFIRWSK